MPRLLLLIVQAYLLLGALHSVARADGAFWREHWYQRGLTNHNPGYTRQFRINSPEVVLHPTFGERKEARENGLMLIETEENLFQITGAEFYAEMWGGHPGTANKRFAINGRTTYHLPKVGAEEGHCTYFYPTVALKITDLVNGWSALQFALDQGTTFWGHSLIENACVRVSLTNRHPFLVQAGLADFKADVLAQPATGSAEGFRFILQSTGGTPAIARVDFEAWYEGYDENGNLLTRDWHGFTKGKMPVAHIGTARGEERAVNWDTTMLPAQKDVSVRARVYFKDFPDLQYLTPATTGLAIAERPGAKVKLVTVADLPKKFWSRAGRLQRCGMVLEIDPSRIERAELYVLTWTGGAGAVKDYFKLNGRHFPVAEGSGHELQFNRLPVDPSLLRRGANTIELLSDTEHHGIEVIYPGPALMLRIRD